MLLYVCWAVTPTFSMSAAWGGAAQATLPGCSLQRAQGTPPASCRADSEMAIRQENLGQCSVREIQRPFRPGKTIKEPTPCFYLRTLYWWGGEGITAAGPSGCLCWWHRKLEKGGKNELKILKSWTPGLTMRSFRISRLKSDLLTME